MCLGAQLADEQRQRQHAGNQAQATADQDTNLPFTGAVSANADERTTGAWDRCESDGVHAIRNWPVNRDGIKSFRGCSPVPPEGLYGRLNGPEPVRRRT